MPAKIKVEFKLNGRRVKDWNSVGQVISAMTDYPDQAKDIARAQAERFIEEVRRIIDSQDPSPATWQALSKGYAYRKGRMTTSDKVYYAKGEFYDKLRVRGIRGRAGEVRITAGANPWEKHQGSGMSMERLATILEYGSPKAGISARPLFGPARARLLPQFKKEWIVWWDNILKVK